jgi:hypothetical protein
MKFFLIIIFFISAYCLMSNSLERDIYNNFPDAGENKECVVKAIIKTSPKTAKKLSVSKNKYDVDMAFKNIPPEDRADFIKEINNCMK